MVGFKLDTGAQASVIPSDGFNSALKETPQLKTTKPNLTGFSESEIPLLGVAKIICEYKDEQIDFDFFVVEAEGNGLDIPVFGILLQLHQQC